MALGGRLVGEDGLPSRSARWPLWRDPRVFVPLATMQPGRGWGAKGAGAPGHGLPGWGVGGLFRATWPPMSALMAPAVCSPPLIHPPRPAPPLRRLGSPSLTTRTSGRFSGGSTAALTARALPLLGLTTAGAALSPVPLAESFGGVRPQRCACPRVAMWVKAVLGAGARARKSLAAKQPQLPTGRPSTQAAQAAARKQTQREPQRGAVCTPRYSSSSITCVTASCTGWINPVALLQSPLTPSSHTLSCLLHRRGSARERICVPAERPVHARAVQRSPRPDAYPLRVFIFIMSGQQVSVRS